jgi:dipeptidyl aminopeptidase/acylaminoacyl peptidase
MHKKYLIFSVIIIACLVVVFLIKTNLEPQTKNFRKPEIQKQAASEKISEPDKDSITEMAKREYNGSEFKLENIISSNTAYKRYYVTYKSEGLLISGALNIPNGKGPFPIVVLNHGYIDPKAYQIGKGGLQREQDFFAKNGFATFYSDYRGYGNSDNDPDEDVRPRSGYVEDVLNGIGALKNAKLENLNTDKIFIFGHSMGGGVTLNIMVTKPDVAKGYVLLAPINSDYKINFDRWVKNDFSDTAEKFYARYGTYEQNPEVWESFSAKNYFDNISRPILIHQGTNDQDVPVEWSRELFETLKNKNKQVQYFEYPNEGHVLYKSEALMEQRTLEFFKNNLK